MRILILADRYIPEISATSFRLDYYARHWVKAGHQVTVVTCAPNLPRGKVFDGYHNGIYDSKTIDGVEIVRIWSYVAPNKGFARRIIDQASFMASAIAQSCRYPKFDIIYASSPPLFVTMGGYMVSRLWRRRWIFELADLWPASIEAVGFQNSKMIRFLEKIELFLYRKSDRIISLTPAYVDNLVGRGISPDKIDVITNAVDTDIFDPNKPLSDVRPEIGVPEGSFLVGYFGTTGMAHGLDTVLEAAKICQNNDRVRFLIMGDGAERLSLEESAKSMGLDNVIFRDLVINSRMPDYLAALNLFLVHLRPHPVFTTVIPSKIFEPMSMNVPILCALDGQGAQVVSEAQAGLCVPPGEPVTMANAILNLCDHPEELEQLCQNPRQCAVEKYSRRSKAEAALKTIELVCNNSDA